MFANIEILSNNTYNFSTFTYTIPSKLVGKAQQGSIVQIKFRNKNLLGIIINIDDKSAIKKVNQIEKVLFNLNSLQYRYLQYVALVNRINIGILIFNMFDIKNFHLQKKTNSRSITNLTFTQINKLN